MPFVIALATGRTDFHVGLVRRNVLDRALTLGLGPILAHITRDARETPAQLRSQFHAADLTARLLTAEKFEALAELLESAAFIRTEALVLKGAATAARYYPAPHLRTMGDLDICVPLEKQEALEARLRSLGYVQRSLYPIEHHFDRHHGMPFWHPRRRLWVELHTSLYPPQYPLAMEERFSFNALRGQLTPILVNSVPGLVMNHELQLVYTSTRFFEALDDERGVYPLIDAALILATRGENLDWGVINELAKHPWANTALQFVLGLLDGLSLVRVPIAVAPTGARSAPATRLSTWILTRLATRYVLENGARARAPQARSRYIAAVWQALVRPASPWRNVLTMPLVLGSVGLQHARDEIRDATRQLLLRIHPNTIQHLRALQRRSLVRLRRWAPPRSGARVQKKSPT